MKRNIVLICLDSVRKDIFDDVAVRTQALADVSFEQCRAASSWSAPSHASMISGLLAHEHSVHTHSRSFKSLPIENTIFADLQNYRTLGISSNIYAGSTYHFDRYFDRFFTLRRAIRFPEALDPNSFDRSVSDFLTYISACFDDEYTFKSLCNGAMGFLSSITNGELAWVFDDGAKPGLRIAQKKLKDGDEPTFVFLNLMEGHIHYRPARYLNSDFYDCPQGWSSAEKGVWELFTDEYDEQYWSRRNQLYRAAVDYLDRCVSEFVQSIDEKTTVIVTSDHGDNLGTEIDEGLANHKSSLSEGLLHVPLCLINAPEVGEQTGRYLSQLAFPELIRGIRNGYIDNLSRDQAFAELVGMSAGPDPEEDYEYYDRAIRCAYNRDEKIVWDSLGSSTRYNLDPNRASWQYRSNDLDRPPSWATSRFSSDIATFKTKAAKLEDDVTVDTSTAERLRELGYL